VDKDGSEASCRQSKSKYGGIKPFVKCPKLNLFTAQYFSLLLLFDFSSSFHRFLVSNALVIPTLEASMQP
jgi:hypothetical protein